MKIIATNNSQVSDSVHTVVSKATREHTVWYRSLLRRILQLQFDRTWPIAIIFLILIIPAQAAAARIELSDGSVLMGEVIERSAGVYTIRMNVGNQVQINIRDVARIDPPIDQPMLRFAGSNTVGEKLIPMMVESYVVAGGGSDIQWLPGAGENERVLKVGTAAENMPEEFRVNAHGSSTAFKALEADQADIGMSSRRIKEAELVKLAKLGDLTNPDSEHVMALDGVAIIVHPNNPVQALTKQQIAGIFAGKITNWTELGGKPDSISIYSRDDKSGTYDTFETLILKSHGYSISPAARRFESSEQLSDTVASDPNGIGFIGLAYIRQAKALDIKECKLSYGPSLFAVKTEEYPLARRLFLYTPATVQTPTVKDFIHFTLSDDGQTKVRQAGFVGLDIESVNETDIASLWFSRIGSALANVQNLGVLQKFVDTIKGAERLSVTFRFQSDSTKLDNRALADIKRLAEYMKTGEGVGKQLLLFGFSDRQGNYNSNLSLSLTRAQAVAKQLAWSGVRATLVKGYGEEAPVGCNNNKAGRDKNRHVEVWVK